MTTKEEIIALLKAENPTLQVGNDNDGYTQLSPADYEATIAEWAVNRLAKLSKQAEAEARATQKAALLDRLGITEEEAQLLLA